MTLIAASCPSKSEAAVTTRIGGTLPGSPSAGWLLGCSVTPSSIGFLEEVEPCGRSAAKALGIRVFVRARVYMIGRAQRGLQTGLPFEPLPPGFPRRMLSRPERSRDPE